MTIKYIISRIRKNSLRHNIIRGLNRIFSLSVLYEYDLNNLKIDLNLNLREGYTIHYANEINYDILESYAKQYRQSVYLEILQWYLSREKDIVGLVILYNNVEVAAIGWLLLNAKIWNRKEGNHRLPIREPVFYSFDGFTVPAHRAKGLHKALGKARLKEAKKRGKRFGYGSVYIENKYAKKDLDSRANRIGYIVEMRQPFRVSLNVFQIKKIHYIFKRTINMGG